ncbi:MAG: ABC transporter ATP-binding protein [Mycobacteriales bacterium]
MTETLAVDGVTVRFGGITAVNDVSFVVPPAQVTGLIGPNGAGKTTTFNVITGLQTATAGAVRLGDRELTGLAPFKRARLGLARTFQRLEVFGSLTARDNVRVATEHHRDLTGDAPDPDELLERVGAAHVAHEQADALPTGLARLVELARALATSPSVLLLDEPGSGLGLAESDQLGDLLLDLAAGGMAVLLVEHDVELVMRVCTSITVLDFGTVIAHGAPGEVQRDPRVQAAYLGAEVA